MMKNTFFIDLTFGTTKVGGPDMAILHLTTILLVRDPWNFTKKHWIHCTRLNVYFIISSFYRNNIWWQIQLERIVARGHNLLKEFSILAVSLDLLLLDAQDIYKNILWDEIYKLIHSFQRGGDPTYQCKMHQELCHIMSQYVEIWLYQTNRNLYKNIF
jgi:hypothetical protein